MSIKNVHSNTVLDTEKLTESLSRVQEDASIPEPITNCTAPGCYTTCLRICCLFFFPDPDETAWCSALGNGHFKCAVCDDEHDDHRTRKTQPKEAKNDNPGNRNNAGEGYNEVKPEARRKFSEETERAEINELIDDVANGMVKLGRLAEEYASLSLLGSYHVQLEKSISLLKCYIRKMQGDDSDPVLIGKLEKGLESAEEKLEILEEAEKRERDGEQAKSFRLPPRYTQKTRNNSNGLSNVIELIKSVQQVEAWLGFLKNAREKSQEQLGQLRALKQMTRMMRGGRPDPDILEMEKLMAGQDKGLGILIKDAEKVRESRVSIVKELM